MAKKKKKKEKKTKKIKKRKIIKREEPKVSNNIYQTKIKIIGIGGGGCAIISDIASQLKKVDFVAANTDLQALKKTNPRCKRFIFGQNLTKGLGCGLNRETGRRAAEEARERIKKILEGADLCILISCLGGGTGSGATPVFAEISQELKNITFGIFTLPFKFEGDKKNKTALNALEKLKPSLNAFSVVPNDNIFKIIDKKTPLKQSLSALNKILSEGLEGLIEMIFMPGLINIDWADLRVILDGKGKICYLSSVEAKNDENPEEIVRKLLQSPLSEYNSQRAGKILYNICSDKNLKMSTVEQLSKNITRFNERAKIIFGISQYPKYQRKIKITLLATSDSREEQVKIKKRPKRKRRVKKVKKIVRTKPLKKPTRKTKKIKIEKPEKKTKKKAKKPIKKKTKKKAIVKVIKVVKEEKKKEKPRKNALQLKKEAEKVEKEILEEEKKWDIPAFLRKGN